GSERHRKRPDRLHEAVRNCDVVHEPGGSGDERLQQGREVGGTSADQGPTRLDQGAAELGVDVLVGKEDRGRSQPAERRPDEAARRDDRCEPEHRSTTFHSAIVGCVSSDLERGDTSGLDMPAAARRGPESTEGALRRPRVQLEEVAPGYVHWVTVVVSPAWIGASGPAFFARWSPSVTSTQYAVAVSVEAPPRWYTGSPEARLIDWS